MYLIYDAITGKSRMTISSEALAVANLKASEAYQRIPEDLTMIDRLSVVNGKIVRDPEPDIDALIYAREIRSARLASSDWTQALDVPLTDTKKAEWAVYRQQLRDFPALVSSRVNDNEYAQAALKQHVINGLLPTPPRR